MENLDFKTRKGIYDIVFREYGLRPYTDGEAILVEDVDCVDFDKLFFDMCMEAGKCIPLKIVDKEDLKIPFTRGDKKPSEVFHANRDKIREVLLRSGAKNPRLFGSVLHGNDHLNSDLDIVVDYQGGLEFFNMQNELEDMLKIPVSVHTPDELEKISYVLDEAEAI